MNKSKTSNKFHGLNLHKQVVSMGHTQNKKTFLKKKNNESKSQAFKNFLFHHIICSGYVMNVFLFCVMFFFLPKRVISSYNSCELINK